MLKITKNQGSIQVTADKSGFYPFDGTITFPTNSLFTATSANTDMITFKSTSNGDVQFVGNYKDITISGRSYDTKQKFLTAFSNLANQGSVDAYTKAETDAKLDAKQGKLKAGNGITLTEDATDNTTVVKSAVSLTDNGNGAYTVGDSIEIGGRSSVRIGNNNNVLQGQNSIVIGDHAITNSEKCIAIGNSSETNVNSTCSIVIGDSARAYGKNSVAIGYSSNATNDNPLVINAGYKTVDNDTQPLTVLQSDANGKISLLKGDGTIERMVIQDEIEALKNAGGGGTVDGLVIDEQKVAVGLDQTLFTDRYSVVIGNQAEAYTGYSVLIGHGAKGRCDDGVVIGRRAESMTNGASGSVVIGSEAKSSAECGLSIGQYAEADKTTPLVINAGVNSNSMRLTMIQGDANGKISLLKGDGTDTRMVIQDEIEALKNAGGSGGGANPYVNVKGVNEGATIADNVTFGIAIGERTNVTKDAGIAIGDQSQAKGSNGVAIGRLSTCIGDSTVAVGDNAKSMMGKSVAIGSSAQAISKNGVAIGSGAHASAKIPFVINAGEDQNYQPLTMIQGDKNGKISILLGDGTATTMCLQDEIAALKAEIAALKGGA